MPRKSIVFLLVIVVCILVACEEELFVAPFPEVTTNPVENISSDGAAASGEITDSKGYSILDHGFIYYKEDLGATNPLEKYEKISLGATGGDGKFSAIIGTNLASQMNYIVKAYASIGDRTIYGAPRSFTSLGGLSPELVKFFPDTANFGDTITLRVNQISRQKKKNVVYFDVCQAPIVSSNDSMMRVIVPQDLSVATCHLKITTGEKSTLSSKTFSLIKPTIDSLSKSEAFLEDDILLYGKNYYGVTGVKIDNEELRGISRGENFISITLPKTLGKGTHVLCLKQFERTISYPNHFAILYPEIKSITPATVWLDSTITVKGKYLSRVKNLKLGGSELSLRSVNDSVVKARVNYPFLKSQLMYSYGNYKFTDNHDITFLLPEITSLSRNTGVHNDEITLKGNNILSTYCVKLGANIVDRNNYDKYTISFKVPPIKSGEYQVSLFNESLNAEVKSNQTFTVLPITINSISKQVSYRGGKFALEFTNFGGVYYPPEMTISLDDINCQYRYLNQKMIEITVPNGRFKSERPTLKINVANQTITKEQAIQIIEPWIVISQFNNELQSGGEWKLINNDSNAFVERTDDGFAFYWQYSSSDMLNLMGKVQDLKKFNWNLIISGNIYSEGFKYSSDMNEKESIASYPVFQPTHEENCQSISFAIDNKAYVGNYDVFNVYDPALNTWQTKSRIPLTSYYNVNKSISFSHKGKGYLIEENNMWEYDPVSDQWSLRTYLPLDIYKIKSACLYKDKLVLFVSVDNLNRYAFYEFDFATYYMKSLMIPVSKNDENLISMFSKNDVLYGIVQRDNNITISKFSEELNSIVEQLIQKE